MAGRQTPSSLLIAASLLTVLLSIGRPTLFYRCRSAQYLCAGSRPEKDGEATLIFRATKLGIAVGVRSGQLDAAMSLSKKRKSSFGGFSSAMEFMNASNAGDTDEGVREQRVDDGADAAGESFDTRRGAESEARGAEPPTLAAPAMNAGSASLPQQNSATVHLLVRGIKYHQEHIQSLDAISLHREPENSYGKRLFRSIVQDERGFVSYLTRKISWAMIIPYHNGGHR